MAENNIGKLRRQRGLTQQKLADAVGVSLPTVQRWEYGGTPPPYDKAEKLAEVLQTTPAAVIGWETPQDARLRLVYERLGDTGKLQIRYFIEFIGEKGDTQ